MDLDKLEHLALQATKGPWSVQTSNSFRRIGTERGDGDVVCAVTQRSDGHPDLHAKPETLEYIAAASPDVILALIRVARAAEKFDDPPPFGDVSALHAELRAALDALGGME